MNSETRCSAPSRVRNGRSGTVCEPDLTTDPALAEILQELIRRELIFHRPEWGTTRSDFERITTPDFWEVGASGCRYSRNYVLDELERRYQVAGEIYLLTYTLLQGQRKTRRATIWQYTADGWKIVFHQGTVVQDEA